MTVSLSNHADPRMTSAGHGHSATEDAAACERPLFHVFAEIADRQPNHRAVEDGTASLTYAELHNRAQALGARIAAAVPPGGLVGVLLPTSVDIPVAWLACLAARRPFLPLDTHLPPARNQAIVAEAGLAAVIVPGTAHHAVDQAADVAACLPMELRRIPIMADPCPPPLASDLLPAPLASRPPPAPLASDLPPAAVGMVLFTSGSSGRPKGIALHERSQLRKALNYRAACGLGPHDRLLSLHPPATNGGAGDVLGALLCGASLHLVELRRDGLAPTLASLRHGGITVCATVPVVVRTLMAMDDAADAFRTLRILRLGGDTVTGGDIAALARVLPPAARVLVRFGMTESGATIAQRLVDPRVANSRLANSRPVDPRPVDPRPVDPPPVDPRLADQRPVDPHAALEPGPLPLDTMVPGQTLDIVDADGRAVAPDAQGHRTGELVISGRYVALGHWRAGALDPAAFPPDPAAPGCRIVRSGDRVTLRADGMLVPIGRTDRQVKINGIRVEPVDTEAALRKLPGVADVAVLAHCDPRGDPGVTELVAFIVRAPVTGEAEPPDAQRARDWRKALATRLPPQLVPARLCIVPAIPLLPSLKPDLAALRALLARDAPDVPPGLLASLWASLRSAASRSRLASSRLASSRLASPRLASPRLASPRLASPRLASPRLASPRLGPPRLASQPPPDRGDPP